MSKITKIQIYGERCTGTNYLEELLISNFNVTINYDYGWKHWLINYNKLPISNEELDSVLFIVINRNFYNWVRSFYKTPHHLLIKPKSMDEILQTEIHSVNRNGRYYEKVYGNIFELRREKLKNFYDLRDYVTNYEYIKYEELLENPIIFLELLKNKYNLESKLDNLTNILYYKKIKTKPYVNKKYMQFTKQQYEYILNNLDKEYEIRYGLYEV